MESIYVLSKKLGAVRSIDVSEYMGYSKPSVSRAVSLLKSAGYIVMNEENLITLTDSGLAIAKKIYDRHTLLSELLIRLGVSEKTAVQDACKMEHTISDETFEAIQRHMKQYR